MKARLQARVKDGDNDSAPITCYVEVDDADTVADLVNIYMLRFTDVMQLFITGAFTDVTLTLIPDDLLASPFFLWTTPDITSDVEERITFSFSTHFGKTFDMSIPTINEGIFTDSGAGKVADLTDSSVILLSNLMTEDVSNNGINAVDVHGADVTIFNGGVQRFGKR